jgi:hypothetical protein
LGGVTGLLFGVTEMTSTTLPENVRDQALNLDWDDLWCDALSLAEIDIADYQDTDPDWYQEAIDYLEQLSYEISDHQNKEEVLGLLNFSEGNSLESCVKLAIGQWIADRWSDFDPESDWPDFEELNHSD